MSVCVLCGHHETGERPYCAGCTFAVHAEAEDGLRKLQVYLGKVAAFEAWEATR